MKLKNERIEKMMKLKFYAVFDKVAKHLNDPVLFVNDESAVRALGHMEPEHNFRKFGQDYSLLCLGEFDRENMTVSGFDAAKTVVPDLSLLFVKEENTQG